MIQASPSWEQRGYILVQLKAIVVLEPEASGLIDEQRADERAGMEALARALSKAGLLRDGVTQQTAAAALHALTSVETFLALRRDYRLRSQQSRARSESSHIAFSRTTTNKRSALSSHVAAST